MTGGQDVSVLCVDGSVISLSATGATALRHAGIPSGHAALLAPDGSSFITVSGPTANVLDVGSGSSTALLSGHATPITCVGFRRDGRRIVTGSSDLTVRIWAAASGSELGTLLGHAWPVIV